MTSSFPSDLSRIFPKNVVSSKIPKNLQVACQRNTSQLGKQNHSLNNIFSKFEHMQQIKPRPPVSQQNQFKMISNNKKLHNKLIKSQSISQINSQFNKICSFQDNQRNLNALYNKSNCQFGVNDHLSMFNNDVLSNYYGLFWDNTNKFQQKDLKGIRKDIRDIGIINQKVLTYSKQPKLIGESFINQSTNVSQ